MSNAEVEFLVNNNGEKTSFNLYLGYLAAEATHVDEAYDNWKYWHNLENTNYPVVHCLS